MAHLGVKLEPNTVFGLVSGSHSIFFAASEPDEVRVHECTKPCTKSGMGTLFHCLGPNSELASLNFISWSCTLC